jgi:hypothetical protein
MLHKLCSDSRLKIFERNRINCMLLEHLHDQGHNAVKWTTTVDTSVGKRFPDIAILNNHAIPIKFIEFKCNKSRYGGSQLKRTYGFQLC